MVHQHAGQFDRVCQGWRLQKLNTYAEGAQDEKLPWMAWNGSWFSCTQVVRIEDVIIELSGFFTCRHCARTDDHEPPSSKGLVHTDSAAPMCGHHPLLLGPPLPDIGQEDDRLRSQF